jgi:hypothetical protein
MKNSITITAVSIAIGLLFSSRANAIEGLALSVQASNAILSWPSSPDEAYVVQFRPTLNSTSSWLTLTSSLSADAISNLTFYVHSNSVLYPPPTGGGGSTNGGGLPPLPGDGDTNNVSGGTNSFESTVGFYQVARLGVHVANLENLTNGVVSNTVAIPFEVANEVGILQDVVVAVDGTRYRGAEPNVTPQISGQVTFDTSFLENGEHTVEIAAKWLNPDETDVNNHFLERVSAPFVLTVSNTIYYPDWSDEIGELGFAFYSFKTTCTNSDWEIDIYDVSNNLAKTLTGNTGDGVVETNWDLVDLNGITRATNDADLEFTAWITVGDPVTKKTPAKRKPVAYPSQGQWAIAYQDMFGGAVNSNDYQNAIYDFGGMASQYGGAYSYFPVPGHPEYGQTFPMRYQYLTNAPGPTGLQVLADENALIQLATNTANRNFFYAGHSDGESIATVDAVRIATQINKRHYYRFVFIDGCASAAGSLPAAFGINLNSAQPLSYFQKQGMRPRTFVGYSKIVNLMLVGDFIDSSTSEHFPYKVPDSVYYFLTNLEFYWNFNYDISTAIYNAESDLPVLMYGWADGPDLRLFGYEGLRIDEYNHQTDWSN